MERIAPSARLEAQIAELLTQGLVDDGERLAEVGWLGARLVLQRAVEDEVTAFLASSLSTYIRSSRLAQWHTAQARSDRRGRARRGRAPGRSGECTRGRRWGWRSYRTGRLWKSRQKSRSWKGRAIAAERATQALGLAKDWRTH